MADGTMTIMIGIIDNPTQRSCENARQNRRAFLQGEWAAKLRFSSELPTHKG